MKPQSNTTNAVATMDTPITNDPPTVADMELMRTKYNELMLAARRQGGLEQTAFNR